MESYRGATVQLGFGVSERALWIRAEPIGDIELSSSRGEKLDKANCGTGTEDFASAPSGGSHATDVAVALPTGFWLAK